jgi:hypothetical protein
VTHAMEDIMASCKGCGGSGDCHVCKGKGRTGMTNSKCARCDGSGKCTVCKGTGKA